MSSQDQKSFAIKCIYYSLGIIFIWFGALKFFPGLSPAEELAGNTIHLITFKLIPGTLAVRILAVFEVFIGILFILGHWKKLVLILFMMHMVGTFTPLFLLMDTSFKSAPFVLTLVGQYIIKNILFVAIGFWLWQESK